MTALANPLGTFRNFRVPGGIISRQARISQTFRPNSLCFAAEGSEHAQVPLSSAPNPAMIVLGCFVGKATYSSGTSADTDGIGALNTDGSPAMVQIRPGIADGFATGTGTHQIKPQHVDLPCYALDDNTVYLDDLGGTLPFAGFIDAVAPSGNFPVSIRMGEDQRTLFQLFSAAGLFPGGVATTQDVAVRCVITTIAAYSGSGTGTLTANATGAIGAQDTSETLLAGDLVFLPAVTGGAGGATVAKDSGVWEVVDPGGATKFKLTRPAQFMTGEKIKPAMDVKVKFGTIWQGNVWKSFVGDAVEVVDTNDPKFYPRIFTKTGTLTNGSLAMTALWLAPNALAVPILNGAPVSPGFLRISASATSNGAGTATITSTSGADGSPVALEITNF